MRKPSDSVAIRNEYLEKRIKDINGSKILIIML